MIPSGVTVYVASAPVDFRKGPVSLMALVRDGGVDPFDGSLYVFRSKRADRVKIVWWDGSGVASMQKRSRNRSFAGRGSGPRVSG
ncbi:IS66 family insertion sequence element accessory protein TnpB [Mesorhizobium sp. M1163]|uniref:IS66 family insertion sequence element accessory protein TnpB n=1 Tax=Mesorhizobium sp. M1163 TaxID=2957065 RepID=UPI0033361B1A